MIRKKTPEEPKRVIEAGLPEQEQLEQWEKIKKHLKELSAMESLSGYEYELRQYLREFAEKLGIKTSIDLGNNLWLHSKAPEKNVMLCAHMDKVGIANEVTVKNGKAIGRLDDAFGMSLILGLLESGQRPTVLFTVEEERHISLYEAGAESATGDMIDGLAPRPDLALILDVSMLGRGGDGPIIYTSSAGRKFPLKPLEQINELLDKNKMRALFTPGKSNDSSWFTDVKGVGVATLQVHVDAMHTENEVADVNDIMEAANVLKMIVDNHSQFTGNYKQR